MTGDSVVEVSVHIAAQPELDSVGDLGNRRRVAVEDRLVASRLPQVGVVDRPPEVVRCRCVPGSERKSRSSPRG